MQKLSRTGLLLLFFLLSSISILGQTTVITDPLQGSTLGTRVGGSFSAEGYKPGMGANHILYDSPVQVINGYAEFQIKGFSRSAIQDAEGDADNGFIGLYDGRGITEPIQYFDDFKTNFFRWNFHYRQNRMAYKGVLQCAAPTAERLNATKAVFGYDVNGLIDKDWGEEPTGIDYFTDVNNWYTIRVEWNNKVFTITINGTIVWQVHGPYDYAPIDFKIWLGSAPGHTDKYVNSTPDIVYRNFKLVSYGAVTPPVNTPPVITSSAVTSAIEGQLYSYDVNATGNPTPSYSLTTFPTGMTINSSTGLINWTPNSTGNFNVTVKAANGVSPDATQSFVVSVQANQSGGCPTGIVSYWKLDETSGSIYLDVLGANNATSGNTPTPTAGRVNGAQQFNGTSDEINAPRIAAYDFAVNTSFTFEAWIKHPNVSISGEEIIVERKSASGALAINLKFDGTTNARFSARNNNYAEIFSVTGTTNLFDNNWHHVVGVRDAGTNQLRIYVDGVLQNTAPAVYTTGFTSADEGISLGRRRSTNNKFFNGSIDEVAIYNTALDAASILQHYNNGLQNLGYCDESGSGTSPLITSTALTSGVVGQLYSYDVNATGNPTPSYSLTVFPSGMTINSTTGVINWTPSSTGNFNVTTKAANGVSPDATQSFVISVQDAQTGGCPSSMISYWKLDETSGSTFDDYVGGNDASSSNLPTTTVGRVNAGRSFNGTTNEINAPRIAAYDFAVNTSFTFEAWVKHPNVSISGEEIIVERKSASGALAINLKFDGTTSAKFSVRNNNYAEIFSVIGTTNLFDNNWHHVVGVRDAGTNQLMIYVNGVLQNTAPAVYTAGFTSADEGISMGRRRSTNNKFFNGSIDEVAIYNSALDAASILQHYNNGLLNNGYCDAVQPPVGGDCPPSLVSYWKLDETSGSAFDDYVGGNDASSSNLPLTTTGRVNAGRLFNGTSNEMNAPKIAAYDFSVNTSFTFEAWIKHPSLSGSEEIILERKPASEGLAINLKLASANKAIFSVRNDSWQIFTVTGTKLLNDGNWHHLVGVRDASTNQLRIYVDGVLEGTSATVYSSGFTSADEGISIGRRRSTNNKFFNGSIDEVAIYNSALDAASILQHYNSGLSNQGYCQNVLAKSTVSNVDIFSSVESHINGTSIQLAWEINSNLNEGKFEIERSESSMSAAQVWQKISEVDLSARGEQKSFVFVDKLNASGKFSYRIKYANGGTEIYSQQTETEVLPMEYVLYQNYPNPFNPSTKIRFAIPLNAKVTIDVYNQLGEVVSQPVNNFYEAGNYEVDLNMSNLASGVYFYKITAGTFSDIKKMMLTK